MLPEGAGLIVLLCLMSLLPNCACSMRYSSLRLVIAVLTGTADRWITSDPSVALAARRLSLRLLCERMRCVAQDWTKNAPPCDGRRVPHRDGTEPHTHGRHPMYRPKPA
jgi:hypothetical protein